MHVRDEASRSSIDLLWLPLGAGAGGRCVRGSGRAFEALAATRARRDRQDLYHSALVVHLRGDDYAVEMAPVWSESSPDRGVVAEGPVGSTWLGRARLFRYEVRRWRGGVIPDAPCAVDSPQRLSADADRAEALLALLPDFPARTWGRDELGTGDMWNSNSLISWSLSRSGHDLAGIGAPAHGRAPGWRAGLVVAARAASGARASSVRGP